MKKLTLALLTLFVSWQLFSPTSIVAQRRDHLSEMEIELIRDEQSIERRMEIYVKAIDRRLLVLNNDQTQVKQIEKDLKKWGELPKGTRSELLRDIEKILDETISKIDDVASRDLKSKLLPVAVNVLADGANRFVPELKKQFDQAADQREKGAVLGALDHCAQIIEASAKVPKLTEKEMKKIQKEAQKEAEKAQQPD